MESTVSRNNAIATATLGALLLLVGCSLPAASSGPYANDISEHSTAAGGWGLGPQDFHSNGGAFGPDQLSH